MSKKCQLFVYSGHAQITAKINGMQKSSDLVNTALYYTALSHKDWELPNARIWLAEMDIDRGLDFPI